VSGSRAVDDVLLGAGLYETVRVSGGAIRFGERHLMRMQLSADVLGLPVPEREEWIAAVGAAAGEGDVVRLCLYRDDDGGALYQATRRPARPGDPVTLASLEGWYAPGYALREHKLTSHFHGVWGPRRAEAGDALDALLVTRDRLVGEAANANVFAIIDGTVVTPAVDGLLPGIARAALIEVLQLLGEPVEERPLAVADLFSADSVFLTSAPRGIVEASSLDGFPLMHSPPEWLSRLRGALDLRATATAIPLAG
jgi:branched-subunit amino acid aminotransferase/4-amino-4-deoxychorismate lyase